MNDENISALCNELDKLREYVGDNKIFTREWLENEYNGITTRRDLSRPTYRNEYRIIKTLIDAWTSILLRNAAKLKLFVPASKIIKSIEDSIKQIFNQRQQSKPNNDALEKLVNKLLN